MTTRYIDVPPVWLIGCAAVAFVLARLVPAAHIGLPAWLGWLACAVGLVWAAAAVLLFLARKTPVEPRHHPKVLLVEGPFRINRNPIYSGMTLFLIGWAVVLGDVSALVPAVVFPFVITRRFILAEERSLIAAFGQEGEDYLARTRRW